MPALIEVSYMGSAITHFMFGSRAARRGFQSSAEVESRKKWRSAGVGVIGIFGGE